MNEYKESRRKSRLTVLWLIRFLVLQMKPSTLILTSHAEYVNAVETGRTVGALVKKHGMANQVIVSSFDLLKSLNAKMVRNKVIVTL